MPGPVHAATEKVLFSFQNNSADGIVPAAALISLNGGLYSTAAWGGAGTCDKYSPYGCGTVFSVEPSSGAETVIYSFQNNGTDGTNPSAPLIKIGRNLYGTTAFGGTKSCGTVFSIDSANGNETVLHSFQCDADGQDPDAGLIDVSGTLFGTANEGGAHGGGTVYSVDPSTKPYTVLYSFCSHGGCADGKFPQGNLLDVKETLYGTTAVGGAYNAGTVFAIDPSTHAETVVHSFYGNTTDGLNPEDGLIDVNGKLYGTTSGGGGGSGCNNHGCGTILSLDLATNKENVLYVFQGSQNGDLPTASLLSVGRMLYGTTEGGGGSGCGGSGCGMVFSFDRKTRHEKVLHAFQDDGADGQTPNAALIDVTGTLYGTTLFGGTDDWGTVFEIKP